MRAARTNRLHCPTAAAAFATTTSAALLLLVSLLSVSAASAQQCTSQQQRSILPTVVGCAPRPQVVALDLPNATFNHIVPDRVMVNKCGGSCDGSRYHSCVATVTRPKRVDVLLMSAMGHNQTRQSAVCAEAVVQEDEACACGCSTSADSCLAGQRFVPQECRCVCTDSSARLSCLAANRVWSAELCRCLCRAPADFDVCSTGYHFDAEDCRCVPHAEVATAVLEVVALILVCSLLVSGAGLVQCYRSGTGLFRGREGDPHRPLQAEATELRALFRALSHQGHVFAGYAPHTDEASRRASVVSAAAERGSETTPIVKH